MTLSQAKEEKSREISFFMQCRFFPAKKGRNREKGGVFIPYASVRRKDFGRLRPGNGLRSVPIREAAQSVIKKSVSGDDQSQAFFTFK